MIAGCLKSVSSVNTRSVEDGAAAEGSGRALLKSHSDKAGAPRAVFITAYFIKQMIKRVCGSVHASRLSMHLCAFSLRGGVCPPWQRSKMSVRSWCEMEGGRGSRERGVGGFISHNYHRAVVQGSRGQYRRDYRAGEAVQFH